MNFYHLSTKYYYIIEPIILIFNLLAYCGYSYILWQVWRFLSRYCIGIKIFLMGINLLLFSFLYKSCILFVVSGGDFNVSFAPVHEIEPEFFYILYEVIFDNLCNLSMILITLGIFYSVLRKEIDIIK